MGKRKENVQILSVISINNTMKNLKQIAKDKQKELATASSVANKKYMIFQKKPNWTRLIDGTEWKKIFAPEINAYKQHIKAELNYLNSAEYINGEYKTDRKKYKELIVKINHSLKKLKNICLSKKNDDFMLIKIGINRKYYKTRPEEFIISFTKLKKVYGKKPGIYTYKDVETLLHAFTLRYEGKDIFID